MDAKPGDKPWHFTITLLSGRTVEIDADPNWHLDSKTGLSGFDMLLQGLCGLILVGFPQVVISGCTAIRNAFMTVFSCIMGLAIVWFTRRVSVRRLGFRVV